MNRLLAVVFFVPLALSAAEPSHTPLPLRHPVQDKNFFVMSLMERTPAVANDAELKTLLAAKRDALHKAATACEPNVDCFAAAMRWSDAEVAEAAQALRHLYDSDQAVRDMTDGVLRRSVRPRARIAETACIAGSSHTANRAETSALAAR